MIATSRRLTIASLLLLAACASSNPIVPGPPPPPPPPPPAGTLNLLFVGNSLTDSWSIPDQVVTMAEQVGLPRPIAQNLSVGGYSLEDHWNQGIVNSVLGSGTPFNVMIMQQGPSTLASSGVNLTEFFQKFAQRANLRGTRPALYMSWPAKGGDIDAGIANHVAAAAAANGALYPVGAAFKRALNINALMPLYAEDLFHPSEHGAWLAALVIVAMIYDRPVADFPNMFPSKITLSQEQQLRDAASGAILEYGKR